MRPETVTTPPKTSENVLILLKKRHGSDVQCGETTRTLIEGIGHRSNASENPRLEVRVTNPKPALLPPPSKTSAEPTLSETPPDPERKHPHLCDRCEAERSCQSGDLPSCLCVPNAFLSFEAPDCSTGPNLRCRQFDARPLDETSQAKG